MSQPPTEIHPGDSCRKQDAGVEQVTGEELRTRPLPRRRPDQDRSDERGTEATDEQTQSVRDQIT